MCNYCNDKKEKEVVFKSEIGLEISICVSCINWEIDNLSLFYCEECEDFHDVCEKNYEEYDSRYLCNQCFWDSFSEHQKEEEIALECYRLSK